MHTQSESHYRQMLLVGEDPKKFINDYSNQFHRDFLQLLRTSHGEKMVHMNHFYQEYIHNKEHVHMNATKWLSLTEYAKYLGRESICRVEENEKGLHIAWIDNSPEKLRRQDAIRKKERMDKGDEEREQFLIREQVKKAQKEAEKRAEGQLDETERELKRAEGEKIRLNFGVKLAQSKEQPPSSLVNSNLKKASPEISHSHTQSKHLEADNSSITFSKSEPTSSGASSQLSIKMSLSNKPKNVFAAVRKNALGAKKAVKIEQPKKMSEAERIMREETEEKSKRMSSFSDSVKPKKQKVG
ncbi:hypothetical protein EPUL_005892 [Erysiphe pulchra]|uniref:DNA/RNA-binding protein Kin17 WH-like domain-containing protein n=1 Tax=Erysiphe pulchra TaxID=225359 RepID=A0A2S4PV91_9PEZI|nr:hypothetical protein EPUL_005892 [Erysiphe pulchra]